MRWTWSTSQRGWSLSASPQPPRNAATSPTSRRWRRCCGPNMAKTIWWETPWNEARTYVSLLFLPCILCWQYFMISGAQPERAEGWTLKVKPQGTNTSADTSFKIWKTKTKPSFNRILSLLLDLITSLRFWSLAGQTTTHQRWTRSAACAKPSTRGWTVTRAT